MPICQRLIIDATCDICAENIDTGKTGKGYINAGVYGAAFHVNCVTPDMIKILRKLELDDITLVNNRDESEKLIHSRLYR